jgi:hypothetical protein
LFAHQPGLSVEPAFRAIVRELEPRVSFLQAVALPTVIEKSYAPERYRTVIVTVFGVLAALLAAVGLYGVSVARGRAPHERDRYPARAGWYELASRPPARGRRHGGRPGRAGRRYSGSAAHGETR